MKAKYALIALALTACIPPHLDENVAPSNDALWMPVGVGLDASMQLTKLPWYVRIGVLAGSIYVVRVTPVVHKPLDSGFDIAIGATGSELIGFVIRGVRHQRQCQWADSTGIHSGVCH